MSFGYQTFCSSHQKTSLLDYSKRIPWTACCSFGISVTLGLSTHISKPNVCAELKLKAETRDGETMKSQREGRLSRM